MSKNNFSEELEALQGSRKSSRNPLKIDQIIKKLVKDGQKDEADAIISAAGNEELPMFTLFTALRNYVSLEEMLRMRAGQKWNIPKGLNQAYT